MSTTPNVPFAVRRMPPAGEGSEVRLNPPVRRNRLKSDLAQGRHLLGTSIELANNPAIVLMLAAVELDYFEVDLDMSAMPLGVLADIAVAARAVDLPMIVHPRNCYDGAYGTFLEAGIWGLSLNIDSVAEAREVVQRTRHAPLGLRGTFEPGPQNDYQNDPQDLTALNGSVHITARIGTPDGCMAAESILAIDGIDAVELDEARLAHHLAPPAASELVCRSEALLLEAARRCGKAVSAAAASERQLRALARKGVRLLRYRSDSDILKDSFGRVAHLLEKQN